MFTQETSSYTATLVVALTIAVLVTFAALSRALFSLEIFYS